MANRTLVSIQEYTWKKNLLIESIHRFSVSSLTVFTTISKEDIKRRRLKFGKEKFPIEALLPNHM